jgi:hypothetical protein
VRVVNTVKILRIGVFFTIELPHLICVLSEKSGGSGRASSVNAVGLTGSTAQSDDAGFRPT